MDCLLRPNVDNFQFVSKSFAAGRPGLLSIFQQRPFRGVDFHAFVTGVTRKRPTIITFLPESVATAELAPVRFSSVFRTARALRVPVCNDATPGGYKVRDSPIACGG